MVGKVSDSLWKTIAFVWLWIEIGQFIEGRTLLGRDALFWPLWTCIVLVVFLVTYILDAHLIRASLLLKWKTRYERSDTVQVGQDSKIKD